MKCMMLKNCAETGSGVRESKISKKKLFLVCLFLQYMGDRNRLLLEEIEPVERISLKRQARQEVTDG